MLKREGEDDAAEIPRAAQSWEWLDATIGPAQSGLVQLPPFPHDRAVLNQQGFELMGAVIDESRLVTLRQSLFDRDGPGTRCLLDQGEVRDTAVLAKTVLMNAGRLSHAAVAIQAIAFDKTSATNWTVPWHQDVMFPFAQPVRAGGFALPSKKDGVDYARPPREVLEALLAVRIHLDDCDEENGPLRVSPRTHRHGIVRSTDLAEMVSRHGEMSCLAKAGDALLMKPLLLHASSRAIQPKHRRVLHLVYHDGPPMAESWHRAI